MFPALCLILMKRIKVLTVLTLFKHDGVVRTTASWAFLALNPPLSASPVPWLVTASLPVAEAWCLPAHRRLPRERS